MRLLPRHVQEPMVKGARGASAYQTRTINKAFEEFATLWLDQFDQKRLPSDTGAVCTDLILKASISLSSQGNLLNRLL